MQVAHIPRYTYEEYTRLDGPREAWQTRLFLYCQLRLFELYTGDGMCKDHRGQATYAEYLCENRRLVEMTGESRLLCLSGKISWPEHLYALVSSPPTLASR
jgi:hypothetical protein